MVSSSSNVHISISWPDSIRNSTPDRLNEEDELLELILVVTLKYDLVYQKLLLRRVLLLLLLH